MFANGIRGEIDNEASRHLPGFAVEFLKLGNSKAVPGRGGALFAPGSVFRTVGGVPRCRSSRLQPGPVEGPANGEAPALLEVFDSSTEIASRVSRRVG